MGRKKESGLEVSGAIPQTVPGPDPETAPRVSITATASADGKRITLIFPYEFIKEVVAIVGDNYGRHRVLLSPVYGGHDVVGFVTPTGVKYGKVEINPAAHDLKNVIPGKTNRYWGRQRETDILIGKLLTELCDQPPAPPVTITATASASRPVPQTVRPPLTIEEAVDYVNEWVQKNNGVLAVEDNAIAIEVRQRIGGKKNG